MLPGKTIDHRCLGSRGKDFPKLVQLFRIQLVQYIQRKSSRKITILRGILYSNDEGKIIYKSSIQGPFSIADCYIVYLRV